jgi:acetyl-CoA C-acetyltransferase
MTDIVIAGIGQTPVGEHWGISLRSLAVKAMRAAIQDADGLQPQALYVGNMLAANLSRQAHLGTLLADFGGLRGIEAASFEAAGASGGAALRQGYLAIASGYVDSVLVVGVEKFTDMVGPEIEGFLANATDSDYETVQGLTPTAQAAMLARRYAHEFDVPPDGLSGFPLIAHANGAGNPNAMYRKALAPDTYQKAEMICDPLNLYDIGPNADGAAALLLTCRELLPTGFHQPLVRIAASTAATDTLGLHNRLNPLWFSAAQLSVEKALSKAGIALDQINLFEYHDGYSIFAALSLEAAGFAKPGYGWKMAADGSIGLHGKVPCATMGGCKARGHPGGATGVYQAVEAVMQLRGQAGGNQVADAHYALIQSLGGPASTAVTHILERAA